MTPGGLYDGRFIYGIGNSAIYVHKGRVRVFYFSVNGKMNLESAQSCSQTITNMTLIMYIDLPATHHLIIPAGKLFIIQAQESSSVVISRFFCGLTMRRHITAYRQLYTQSITPHRVNDASPTDESFKWQFWKVVWLTAMRYVRCFRHISGVSLTYSSVDEVGVSSAEKANIPFLIVALKIMHEIYGSHHNELQQFEQIIAGKVECLGPLDLLMELATRCRDNEWRGESHRLQHPDDMSMTSEDTQAVMDVSPYPDSIDSNEYIDQFVVDAKLPKDEKESDESWEFRCNCGIEEHNYDDGKAMVQCGKCGVWCHQECVHYDPDKDEEFFCKWCQNKLHPRKRKGSNLLDGNENNKYGKSCLV